MTNSFRKALGVFSLTIALLPGVVSAQEDDGWKTSLSIYGWLPDLSGTTSFPAGGGNDFTLPIETVLDNLSFTFQGTFDARRGQWGMFSDVIYMDLNKKKNIVGEGTIGGIEVPVDARAHVGLGMKSWVWTTAAYFRAIDEPGRTFDFLGGVRYLDVSQTLNWNFSGNIGEIPLPGREGSAKVGASYWDFIVGFRGRAAFGKDNAWFLPYYLDVGTGNSDFTWQALAGVGYAFNWGELVAAWRFMDYELPSDKAVTDLDFGGPVVGAIFRW